MDLLEVQIASLFLLLVGTFFCGILPVIFFRYGPSCIAGQQGRGSSRATSFLIYFGGGVLLSTALLHLLPDARDDFGKDAPQYPKSSGNCTRGENSSSKSHHHTAECSYHHGHSFPLPELIVICGFFVTYLAEVLLHLLLDRSKSPPESHHHHHHQAFRAKFCSCSMRNIECSRPYKHMTPSPKPGNEKRRRSATWAGLTGSKRFDEKPPDILQSSITAQPQPNYGTVEPPAPDGHARLIHGEGGITIATRAVATPPHLPNIPEVSGAHELEVTTTLSISSLLTVAALSFHAILEGLAIGFQQTTIGTWTMLLAISLHKFVIAFVIGVEAVADNSKSSLIAACMAIFASMSPAGMAIAMLTGVGRRQVPSIVVGVMNSLATGTLLFVIFFEIWPRKSKYGLCTHRRFAAMMLGSALMAGVQYATTLF